MQFSKFKLFLLFVVCLMFFGVESCRSPKDGMTRRERKAWEVTRAQAIRDSITEDSLASVALQKAIERARLDSIRIADSIAALPPPIDYDTVFLASILRTSCYGKCPHYEIRLYASGYATYEGKKYTPRFGSYEANLDSAKVVDALKARIEAVNYMDFELQYPLNSRGVTDFPLTVTAYQENGYKKIIYNRNDAPTNLIAYERFFDSLFENVEWKVIKKRASNGLVPRLESE